MKKLIGIGIVCAMLFTYPWSFIGLIIGSLVPIFLIIIYSLDKTKKNNNKFLPKL